MSTSIKPDDYNSPRAKLWAQIFNEQQSITMYIKSLENEIEELKDEIRKLKEKTAV